MEDEKAQGVDSSVGHFQGVDIRMEYDYGHYSGDPANEKAPGYEDQWTRIDDRLAHVSYWRRGPGDNDDYQYFGSVYFPDTEDTSDTTPKPTDDGLGPIKLNLIVYSNDGFEDAERILTSIRFED